MISFMHMSNLLSEQLKQQYKSKSVYWRQEKEKLLQTFQPKQSQSQQKSRTSERKSKIRNLVDSLYNQGTPDKNKSIYLQFQSQITKQPQQQSSTKKDELTLSTIISKYQRQVENCNNNHIVHDPIAEQIIESFQQLKKQSAKKPELQKCQSDQKIIENSAHKINIIGRINQIREFIDSQLGPSADDSRKDTKQESQFQSEGDYSSGNLRNKSVEFRQFLDQRASVNRDPSVGTFNHRINKRRSIKSCTTLDVGIQVTLLNEDLIALALQQQQQQIGNITQFNSKNHSHILVQQQDHQSGRGSEKSLQEQIQSFQVKNTQQQTSPMNTQSPFYQVEQSVTSEYTLPLQQMLQQQRIMDEDLDGRSKNSGRMSRRSEFLREQEKGRFSANLNDFNKERGSVQQGNKERISQQERFSVPLNEIQNQEQILKNIDFNAERVSVKSNELVNLNKERQSINRDRLSINKERFSVNSNMDQENRENRERVSIHRVEVPTVVISNGSNKENFLDFQQKFLLKKDEVEIKIQESKLENRLNQIEIPKVIHALNFDNFELNKPNVIQQTSVDTNRFQIEIQQIMAKQNETLDFQFQKQSEQNNNTIQQDFILTSNRSQLSVPITEPTQLNQNPLSNNNYIIVEEEIEAAQPDIRIIENATGITEGNLQYSEDTANQRIVTQMSNNQDEQKFKVDSYVTCDIQFKQAKQGQQINQLQSTQSNQLNQSSFEQWLSQGDHNKKIFNFNCQSQYFQKEKCDHSTQINNKSDSESDEEIQFIKKKHQENQSNQGITLLVRKISSIMQIRLIKAFFELKEHSIHSQSQQQFHSCRLSLNTYHSPIMSQFTSQYSSHQQSQQSLPPIQTHTLQTQENCEPVVQQIPQVPKVQAAQEKISNLLKTIMEETGSDTLRMLKNKQSTSPQTKQIEKVRQSSQNSKIKTSKKNSTISIVTSLQSPVQEINDRIKVNFIQEMGLESPVQKHTEHAELNDFSPIAEPMEFQDNSVLGRKKKENKALVDSNIGSNQINNSASEQKHCQILSNHIAIQKAKIAKKFQQIHYKIAGQQQFRKENYQF